MGNQVGSVSSAEVNSKYSQCLQDLTEYELQAKLKETAFFKVVRSRHAEGDVVLKVYIPPNASVPIKEYLDRIEAQKRAFPNPTNANVLPYARCHYSERYACLVRQYVKYSLYDRMDTRPFLLDVEKRWIAFQLLCAIATLNKVSLCHGDIKSENVLLTSWGWVLLTDFAPFKPVCLPDDNPADYSFYFDISGRRTCYIAPERFYHANRSAASSTAAKSGTAAAASSGTSLQTESDIDYGTSGGSFGQRNSLQQASPLSSGRGQLEHSMDVFSAGCVLLELFSEDSNSQPFDLSQLLAFKKDQYTPARLILRLADENIRDLITTMLSKEPLSRLTGEELLIQQRGKAFPDYFYTFLKTYLAPFASEIQLPDDKIARLKKALFTQGHIAKFLILDSDKKSERNVGLVIILSLLTSCIRHVRYAQSKLDGLKCLEKLAWHLPDQIVLDRVLPYILDMMTDPSSRVRSCAIRSLSNTVSRIDAVGYKYVNLFADYIFPSVEHLSRDASVQVRCSLAEVLGSLADTAKKFLDSVREQSMAAWLPTVSDAPSSTSGGNGLNQQQEAQHLRAINFEAELLSLRRIVSGLTVTLLHDSCPAVKQAVLCSDALRLCTFFGRREASDHVMSHAITFLNEGPDLRRSFYEQLYCMVAFIGDHGAEMLVPLLEQGLADPDPAVLVSALICLRSLVADKSSDVGRRFGAPLCAKSLPLLSHPDVFVRHAAAGLLCATASRLGPAEFHCRLVAPETANSPRVANHLPASAKRLARSQRHLANEVLVLSALGSPVPPPVWRCLATTQRQLVERLFVALEERRHVRLRANIQDSYGSGDDDGSSADGQQQRQQSPCYAALEEDTAALLAKLGHLGLDVSMEDRLLELRDLALKQGSSSSAATAGGGLASPADSIDYIGVERLTMADLTEQQQQQQQQIPMLPRHLSLLSPNPTTIGASSMSSMPAALSSSSAGNAAQSAISASLSEDLAGASLGSSAAVAVSGSPSSTAATAALAAASAHAAVLPPATGRCAPCRADLDSLLARRRVECAALNAAATACPTVDAGSSALSSFFPNCEQWTPKGVLVNHIAEHRGRINNLSVSPDHRAFVTSSDDATVRLWDLSDCHNNPDQCISGKSKLAYSDFPSRVLAAYWQAGPDHNVVACTESGAYQLCASTGQLRWRWTACRPTSYDAEQVGAVTCLAPAPDSPNCFLVATARGALLTWDVRAQDFVARFDIDPGHGLITALEVHSLTSWLAAGTSRGVVDVWDCRFQLPLVQLRHPTCLRVLRLRTLPWLPATSGPQLHQRHAQLPHPHRLLVSVQGNNEIGDWDLRSCERVRCAWASVAPVLSVTQSTPRGCHALLPVGPDRWYSGSDDCRLRLWDWARPSDSKILAGKFSDSFTRQVAYRREAREALTANSHTDVLFEAYISANNPAPAKSSSLSAANAANVAPGSLLSAQQRASTMGFRDAITDIALLHAGQPYLLTATRDGVIKYWK